MKYIFSFALILILTACSTSRTAVPSPMPKRMKADLASSCLIRGRIVGIIPYNGADTTDICFRHPCQASVAITEVMDCGSGVSHRLVETDIITVRFAFTLAATQEAYPLMRVHYPGLKSGDAFMANVEQRETLSSRPGFVVYDYEVE